MSASVHLRFYQQEEMIDPLFNYLCTSPGSPVVAAPTGVGKSIVINGFIKQSIEADPAIRFMVVAHVKEIVGQNMQSMLDYWKEAPVGAYSAGLKQYDSTSQIVYAGIQSIYKKPELFGHVDAVICDEAHTLSDIETCRWQMFLRGLRKINPALRVIGFTATPFKLGVGLLTELEIFDSIAVDLTTTEKINWFVQEGYLAPLVSKKPRAEIDITNVAMRGGDFDEHSLAEATDKDELNRAVVNECVRLGADRNHWLIYATGKTHAGHLVERFRAKGITCEMLDGDAPHAERTRLIGDKTLGIEGAFQKGEFRALVNIGVLSTGFDFPALDLIALARATQSTGLYIQILGRGTRPHPSKKNCLILDFGSNINRLGPFNAPVIPKPRRKGDSAAGEAPVKACAECGLYVHTRIPVCPDCGYEFPVASMLDPQASQAEVMVKMSPVPIYEILRPTSVHYTSRMCKVEEEGHLAVIHYSNQLMTVSEVQGLESPVEWKQREFSKFWTTAGGKLPIPTNIDDFLDRAHKELKIPSKVEYVSNMVHPRVRKKEYA